MGRWSPPPPPPPRADEPVPLVGWYPWLPRPKVVAALVTVLVTGVALAFLRWLGVVDMDLDALLGLIGGGALSSAAAYAKRG